jgi:predicted transcriptional regulator
MVSREKLQHLYFEEEMTQGEIADELGYSQPYISRKMSEYGMDSDYELWTDEEVEFLEENYQDLPREEITQRFESRTWGAVKDKARDIGVAMSADERRQSEEVLKILRQNAEDNAIEIDFSLSGQISYIVGVLDGDGYTDNKGTVGLEAKDSVFTKKFMDKLELVGFNPSTGERRDKNTVWASSLKFTEWYENLSSSQKIRWLREEGSLWKYIEGQYESDGNLHPSGSPRICSYDDQEKEIIKQIFDLLGLDTNIQQNNVWVSRKHAEKFFDNISSVLRTPD